MRIIKLEVIPVLQPQVTKYMSLRTFLISLYTEMSGFVTLWTPLEVWRASPTPIYRDWVVQKLCFIDGCKRKSIEFQDF
jgi:hypothetical protein